MKNTGNRPDRELPDAAYFEKRIEFLSQFTTEARTARLRNVLRQRTRYMTICLENIYHPQNASALVRHCDAFGIQDLHTVEEICRFRPNTNIVKGTDKWVTFHRSFRTEDALAGLRRRGYRIIATIPNEGDCPPEEFDVHAGPFAVVFGTEHEGVSEKVKEEADGFIRIPMWGFVESLNVSACAAIILYNLSKRLRESDIGWGLSEDEKRELMFDWMMSSVKNAETLLTKFEE
ncbi:MAG: RNA methyltransferase [Rikenellaceae bacterium]|nr:RNA methyltransferase [Rikenellaceae bacterium]